MARRHVLSLLLLTALPQCGVDVIEVREESTTEIPGAGIVGQLLGDLDFAGLLDLDISSSEELRNQGVERHQIDSVRLAGLALTIVDPADQDFAFLEEVSFYVESDGLPRERIAHGGPFDAGATQVHLVLDDVELVEYATADSMDITAEASGRQPMQDTTLSATVDLTVDVNVRGVACGG